MAKVNMLIWLTVISCILIVLPVRSSDDTKDAPHGFDSYLWNSLKSYNSDDENFYQFINNITHGQIYNISILNHKELEKMGHHWNSPSSDVPDFNCSVEEHEPYVKATSVHKLTPYDINVVGAMGDSLTAGFGALSYSLLDLIVEYRGISFSIGGDKNLDKWVTLPNILKKYNPKVKGYSVGVAPALIPVPWNHLNVAVSGATAYGLMKQAKNFVSTLLTDPAYDYFQDWKLLTIFIGGNDLCSCCRTYKDYDKKYTPENYIKEVQLVLDYLHAKVPKLFVNMINAPDVTIIEDLASAKCDITHFIECKCGSVDGKAARAFTEKTMTKYHTLLRTLLESKRYNTRDDFTVVLQPFFDETQVPRLPDGSVDRSYFAPDCFHFSWKAHAASALALWNGMLEPVGKKVKEWHTHENYHCPTTKAPYFYTNLNSKSGN